MSESRETRVTERASVVRADNPGIMTLDGTNTWILREPGARRSVVVDPGPADEDHLAVVIEAAGEVGLVLYTHHHADHTEAFDRMRELTGAPARAIGEQFCSDAEPVADMEVIEVDGLRIEAVATPGHTMDSLCLALPAEGSLLSGDTILGRGTTVVAWPDGALGPYLDSLARLREMTEEGLVRQILPGHGPVIEDPAAVLDFYIVHRQERLDQVRAALAAGDTTAREVVERVYADVDPVLWPAAERSVEAQLAYLRD
ncbi:MBL fold metallo-hydrolase [Aeromicrobium sp. PE09-221]|uniref:MBL fold metallo-hydrolase n=1 Tax=Aeromicrobium sp. PE09-221 TaxID=1898043 RepID=UPI000B3E999F|nr:MBL fold metallo-hydrolase [Aeromicrobium sp. PE09-221]OUZ10088.1 MBL fold metallo-hydrolase [Aeromicrobium sp. PE09-221]